MRQWKSSFVVALVLVIGSMAQAQFQKQTVDVHRVGRHLACQCGCSDTMASCEMLECSSSKPGRERIAKMQSLGYNDQQIIDAFVRDFGPKIYRAEPSAFGWAVPYASILLGLGVIYWFVKRYHRPAAPAAATAGPMEIDDPALEKYREQIEKDLKQLDS